jgi:hypothetical protein
VALLVATLLLAAGCALRPVQTTKPSVARDAGERLEQLWVEPQDLESRDLFVGAGGREDVPDPDAAYRVVGYDKTGHSRGYDVEDEKGRKWRVKIGEEAQSEIVVSRILWAIGYYQPALHYLKTWRMTGGGDKDKPAPGRFRLESDHKSVGRWRWGKKNPYEGKPAYHGLIVANLVLNNWDFGPDQNRIYDMKDGETPRLRFIVQDVGASLGKSRWPWGTRNKIDDFESEGFVKRIDGDRVIFHYRSRHRIMTGHITVEEVVWTCRLLSRLSDAQLRDAFRAADYTPEITERYLRKIKEKIRQGASLGSGPGARASS